MSIISSIRKLFSKRAGMTLSDALAMVAEMQTYHSIP